jgi:antitoxin ParD1/3/4
MGVDMPTRNVVLTERQETLIDALVQSGRYQNASEVLREGLRLIENREAEEAAKLEGLRASARVGINALDRGDFKEFSDASALVSHLNTLADSILTGSGSK